MTLRKVPNSKFQHYKFKIRGKEYTGSTFETDRIKALVVEEREKQRILTQLTQGVRPEMTGKKRITAAFLMALDQARSRRKGAREDEWQKDIPNAWRHLSNHFSSFYAIEPDQLDAFVSKLVGPDPRKPVIRRQSIRRYLGALKRTLGIARDHHGYPITVPTYWPTLMSDISDEKLEGNELRLDEWTLFLQQLSFAPQAFAVMAVALLTGLRANEIARIGLGKIQDPFTPVCSGVKKILYLPGEATKRSRPRTVGLTALAIEMIGHLPDPSYIKNTNYIKAFRSAAKRAGVPHPTLRSARKAVYDVALNNANPWHAKIMLGHRETDSSTFYLKNLRATGDPAMAAVAQTVSKYFEGMIGEGISKGVRSQPLPRGYGSECVSWADSLKLILMPADF